MAYGHLEGPLPPDTILVVDDGPSNRLVIASYLEAKYRILEAENGPEALEVVAREPVDLVLLDVMMPGMDGYEVCRELKRRAGVAFLPVILLTALSEQEDRIAGLDAGADDFLTKPADRTELALRCRAFLELRRKDALVREQVERLARLQTLKDDLVAMILHDVRNPLAGIEGYLQMIEAEAGDPAAVVEDALRALKSSRKLRSLLDGVLEVRLLEEGELPLRREPVDLAALVADAVETLSGTGEAGRAPIERAVPAGLAAVVDRKLLRRALENLLSNAIKYSPRGKPIDLVAREAGGRVELDVADRGPGVPDELKGALFQKFGSVEAKRGEARRGFGLGLHLVKLVAGAHGGDVSVHDRPGGGSIFRLSIPPGEAVAASPESRTEARPARSPGHAEGAP
jgi:signal transduction histidine kinase